MSVVYRADNGKLVKEKDGRTVISDGGSSYREPNGSAQDNAALSDYSGYKASQGTSQKNEALGAETTPATATSAKPEDIKAANSTQKPESPSSPAKSSGPSTNNKKNGSWGSKDPSLWKIPKDPKDKPHRQTLPFMFETQEKGTPTWEMLLPFNPESYRMTYTPRVNVTLTQSGLFEDNIGIAPPKFVISGVFGFVGTTLMGIGKSLSSESKSGLELYHEMETNMFYFYEQFGTHQMDAKEVTAKTDPKQKPVLFFYNFCDQEYWQVQVTQFVLTRNLQRRQLYQYEIQLSGLRRVTKTETDVTNRIKKVQENRLKAAEAEAAKKKLGLWDSFMQKAGSMVKDIQDAVGKATAVFQKIQNEVSKLKSMMTQISTAISGFSNGLTNLIHVPFDVIQTAKNSADSIMSSLDKITGLPDEFRNDMRNIQRLLNGYTRRPEMFQQPRTGPQSVPGGSESNTDALEILTVPITEQMTTQTGATGMQIPEETIFQAGTETTKPVAASQSVISDSDTIATIANSTGTDWKQIATLNNLEYPYIAKTPLDRFSAPLNTITLSSAIPAGSTTLQMPGATIAPGDILSFGDGTIAAEVKSFDGTTVTLAAPPTSLSTKQEAAIPAQSTARVHSKMLSVATTGEMLLIPGSKTTTSAIISKSEDFKELLFGTDEYLDNTGKMKPDTDHDIATVSGLSNLEMQLLHRITTMRGELAELGHPEYGSLVPMLIGKAMTPVWEERILLECRIAVEADPRVERTSNTRFYNSGTSIYFSADVYPINSRDPITVSLPIA